MRRLQILRGQLQYKPELKDGEFFLDKTNHSLLIGDAAAADGQFELAKQSSITNLQQQVNTKITAEQAPVQSVNSKTGAVVLTAADVGALPDTTSIPTKTSELDNDSGFITAAQAPVQSVDGATGAVTTNAVKYTTQTLTDDQKTQARTNIGAGTSSFSGSYNDLSNKPTIPTKVTDLTDAADYATVTSVNAVADDVEMLNSEVGTLTTDVDTLKTNITSKQNTITGGASTITDNNLIANRALVSNGSGKVAVSGITDDELACLSGVNRNIQAGFDELSGLNDSVLLDSVSQTSVLPSSADWKSVTYGDGKFVAVADTSRKAAYSTDGINWTASTLPYSRWYSVTYGNGKFVAVTYSSNAVAYSTDGITWTASTLPSSADWKSVTYGDGKFVAVASDSSNAAYSTDGITWTANTLPSSTYWNSVTYGDGKFVAVSEGSSTNNAAYSTDGITWTSSTLPSSTTYWQSATYGDGKFVAVARNSNAVAYSTDGINWTASTLPSSTDWRVTYGNGKFVAVTYNNSNVAAYSTDGINWTASTLPENNYWGSVTYGNGKFVAIVGYNSNKAAYSVDGITWSNEFSSNTLTSTTGTDITSSVYSALEPYIPTPTVPTKTSELTNDSGYITQTDGDGRYLEIDGSNAPRDLTMSNTGLVVKGIAANNLTLNSDGSILGSTGGITFNHFKTYADSTFIGNGSEKTATRLISIRADGMGLFDLNNTMTIQGLADITSSTNGSKAANKNYVDQYAPHATLVTLTVAGWNSTSKTQAVTVSGILADESKQLIIPMPATASMTAYNDAGIQCTGQAADSLTFTAETVPTTAISVYVTYQTTIFTS